LTAGIAAVGAAVAGLAYQTAQSMQNMDELAKTADRVGASTEGFIALQHGAELAGVSSEQLTGALERFNRFSGEVERGSNLAAGALGKLGINAKAFAGASFEQRIGMVSSALAGIESPAMRASVGMQLFGRSGSGLTAFLATGPAALAEAARDADALGISFSRIDAAKVEGANDAISRLWASVEGLGNQFAIALSPAIEDAANKAAYFIGSIAGDSSLQGWIQDTTAGILGGAGAVWDVVSNIPGLIINGLTVIGAGIGGTMSTIQLTVLEGLYSLVDNAIAVMDQLPFPLGPSDEAVAAAKQGLGLINDAINATKVDQGTWDNMGADAIDAFSKNWDGLGAGTGQKWADAFLNASSGGAGEAAKAAAAEFGDAADEEKMGGAKAGDAAAAKSNKTQLAGVIENLGAISLKGLAMSGTEPAEKQVTEQKKTNALLATMVRQQRSATPMAV